jgi:hypothetical protein
VAELVREQADRLDLVAVGGVADRVGQLGVDDERRDRLAVCGDRVTAVDRPGVRPQVVALAAVGAGVQRAAVVRAAAGVDDPERVDGAVVVVVEVREVDLAVGGCDGLSD